jgi:hypothetical protein
MPVIDGCHLWTAFVDRDGYGKFQGRGAHRWYYEMIVGLVPAGFELDHLCRKRSCVNPDHLEVVTHKVNMNRGIWPNGRGDSSGGGRKVDPAFFLCGHPRTPENTHANGAKGKGRCAKCNYTYVKKERR